MRQCAAETKHYKPGDFISLRPEAMDLGWVPDFMLRAGPGPYQIRKISKSGVSVLLVRVADDTDIYHRNGMTEDNEGSWIFSHFFVRNNFLGACHKAITCPPSKSEQ